MPGGAVSLATPRADKARLAASYQLGLFGTHRATLDARHRVTDWLVAGASGFVDDAR